MTGRRGPVSPDIRVKRVYEAPAEEHGVRLLVERLWPRGLKKEALRLDGWPKDVAPSHELRRWFGHDPSKWDGFLSRYFVELDRKPEVWGPIQDRARRGPITLLYSARDQEHNSAVALSAYLQTQMGQGRRPA